MCARARLVEERIGRDDETSLHCPSGFSEPRKPVREIAAELGLPSADRVADADKYWRWDLSKILGGSVEIGRNFLSLKILPYSNLITTASQAWAEARGDNVGLSFLVCLRESGRVVHAIYS